MNKQKTVGFQRVQSHTIFYETSAEVWQDGFPLGNGQFGGMIYQPEECVFECAVTRLDLWKERMTPANPLAWKRILGLAGDGPRLQKELDRELERWSFDNPQQADLPEFKPAGRLRLGLDEQSHVQSATLFDKQQRLELASGEVIGNYELSGKAAEYNSFVDPENDVMIIHLADTYRAWFQQAPMTQTIELYRLHDSQAQITEHFITDDGIAGMVFNFGETLQAIIAFAVSGVPVLTTCAQERSVSMSLRLDYPRIPAETPLNYTIFLSVQVDRDGKRNLKNDVCALLRRSFSEGWEKAAERNRLFWKVFWGKSYVVFENAALEGLYYSSLYQFAVTSRGKTAPGLFGLFTAEKSTPWHGEYAGDVNLQMTYWPSFALNRPELFEPFFNTFSFIIEKSREETARFYEIDGLRMPGGCGPTGEEISPGAYRMISCCGAFYADLYIKWYDFYPDLKTLKSKIYPVLRDIAKYYLALCSYDTDGKLRFGPGWAPEQGPLPAWNTINDLGLIKPLWQRVVAFARILHRDLALADEIQKKLEHFPEYPNHDGEFIDSDTAKTRSELCHPGYLAPVIPGGDIEAGDELAGLARKSLFEHLEHTPRTAIGSTLSSACDLTWLWMFAAAIRLREQCFAEHILKDIGFNYLKPNGMFGFMSGQIFSSIDEKRKAYEQNITAGEYHHINLVQTSTFQGRERMMTMIQTGSGFLFAINESMLQSQRNELKIFPCTLHILGISQSFHRLRAAGAVTVSAARDRLGVSWLLLEPEQNYQGLLRFFDAQMFGDLQFSVDDNQGTIFSAKQNGAHSWKLVLEGGHRYLWKRNQDICAETCVVAPHKQGIREYNNGTTSKHLICYGKRGRYYATR